MQQDAFLFALAVEGHPFAAPAWLTAFMLHTQSSDGSRQLHCTAHHCTGEEKSGKCSFIAAAGTSQVCIAWLTSSEHCCLAAHMPATYRCRQAHQPSHVCLLCCRASKTHTDVSLHSQYRPHKACQRLQCWLLLCDYAANMCRIWTALHNQLKWHTISHMSSSTTSATGLHGWRTQWSSRSLPTCSSGHVTSSSWCTVAEGFCIRAGKICRTTGTTTSVWCCHVSTNELV